MSCGRRRATLCCTLLVAANAGVWLWAWGSFGGDAVLFGTAALAYAFGLRHAVDADHIAAIDNATRKLIEAGRPAAGTGFFFSLGHATVVVLAALGIAAGAAQLPSQLAALKPFAATFGAGVSAAALFVLAAANLAVLVAIGRLFAAARRGEPPSEPALRQLLAGRGLLARLLRGAFRLIGKSWHMYPLGFLFGLGFDTATEIGLLGVSAVQGAHGLPLGAIMVFPALFAAGMVLVDTADALVMASAYRWAMAEPLRKLRYNMTITAVSVVLAVAIGGLELLGLYAGEAGPAGGVWRAVADLNGHLALLGAAAIALCAAAWLISALVWRLRAAP